MGEATIPRIILKTNAIQDGANKPPTTPLRPKKSFPVEFDPSTGDTFIHLNGKKLKMVPEAEILALTRKLAETHAQKSSDPSIVRIKPQTTTVGKPQVLVTTRKGPFKAKVVQKKYIKVKRDSLSVQITDKAGKVDSDASSSEKTTDKEGQANGVITDKMQALDLSKTPQKSENSTQTEVKEFKDTEVQVPETDSDILQNDVFLGSLLTDFDHFDDILEPQPTYDMSKDKRATCFFQDLRAALQPDDKGNMPIHISVLKNSISMVKKNSFILKTLQQSIDIPNSNGYTALQLAITTNASKEIITFLLENRARLNVHDSDGNNVLHLAFEYRREDAMSTLLDYSDKYDVINEHNHEGMTPLMIGAINGLHGCVEIILDYGALIDLRDQISGRTALFHAAENQDMEMVKLLLHYNANTKIKNFFGTSPHDAMYEIEEVPGMIKHMILGKNLKRKVLEEHLPLLKPIKAHRTEPRIKTYSKERIKTETSGSDIIL